MSLEALSGTIAAALFAAVAAGWVLHWLWTLLARGMGGESARIAHLVQKLDAADRAREAAERARAETEAALSRRVAELEIRLEEEAAAHQAERELAAQEHARQIEQARAEAEAAWDGLANARRRIAELERGPEA